MAADSGPLRRQAAPVPCCRRDKDLRELRASRLLLMKDMVLVSLLPSPPCLARTSLGIIRSVLETLERSSFHDDEYRIRIRGSASGLSCSVFVCVFDFGPRGAAWAGARPSRRRCYAVTFARQPSASFTTASAPDTCVTTMGYGDTHGEFAPDEPMVRSLPHTLNAVMSMISSGSIHFIMGTMKAKTIPKAAGVT